MNCERCKKDIDPRKEKYGRKEHNPSMGFYLDEMKDFATPPCFEKIYFCEKCLKIHVNTNRIEQLKYENAIFAHAFYLKEKESFSYTEMLEMLVTNLHLQNEKIRFELSIAETDQRQLRARNKILVEELNNIKIKNNEN